MPSIQYKKRKMEGRAYKAKFPFHFCSLFFSHVPFIPFSSPLPPLSTPGTGLSVSPLVRHKKSAVSEVTYFKGNSTR
jgi:hypothetical protein